MVANTLYFLLDFFIISQEEYSPEDPANPCVNYPTEEYDSYADCDDHFVRSSLPPGLKPFWTVDKISEATNSFEMEYNFYLKTWKYLGNRNSAITRWSKLRIINLF